MSKIKNGGLDQYGTEPYEQQQFGTAGAESVNKMFTLTDKKEWYFGQPKVGMWVTNR